MVPNSFNLFCFFPIVLTKIGLLMIPISLTRIGKRGPYKYFHLNRYMYKNNRKLISKTNLGRREPRSTDMLLLDNINSKIMF